MPAVPGPFLRRLERLFFGRFFVTRFDGDCLEPGVTEKWAIVDRDADIRAGDVFIFSTRDFREAFSNYPNANGVGKRFAGVNRELGFLQCECTKPAYIIHTGLSNLLWAHRIRATAPTFKEARRLLKAVKRDPAAFDEPLMA